MPEPLNSAADVKATNPDPPAKVLRPLRAAMAKRADQTVKGGQYIHPRPGGTYVVVNAEGEEIPGKIAVLDDNGQPAIADE